MTRIWRSWAGRFLFVGGGVGLSIAAVVLITAHTSSNLAQTMSAVATTAALVGAAVTLSQHRRAARQTLTHDYSVQSRDPKHLALMSDFLRLDRPLQALDLETWKKKTVKQRKEIQDGWDKRTETEQREQKLTHWASLTGMERAELVFYPNFLEELAEMVKNQFEGTLHQYFAFGRWFIEAERRGGTPDAYSAWEAAIRRLVGGLYLPNNDHDREELGPVTDLSILLEAVVRSMPNNSVLFLEGVDVEEARTILRSHEVSRPKKVVTGEPSDGPRDLHLRLDEESLLEALRQATEKVALAGSMPSQSTESKRLCRHLLVYRRRHILLEAYDAGAGRVYLHKRKLSSDQRTTLREQVIPSA
jgi:hypothetical protein